MKVVVVGGGIVGAATAYFLARDGIDVTLVEAEILAHGASGRNPGFVWLHGRNPGFPLEISLAGRALYSGSGGRPAARLRVPRERRPHVLHERGAGGRGPGLRRPPATRTDSRWS